jgi:hypothetical protein
MPSQDWLGIGSSAKKQLYQRGWASRCYRSRHHDLSYSERCADFYHFSILPTSCLFWPCLPPKTFSPNMLTFVPNPNFTSCFPAGTGSETAWSRCGTLPQKDCKSPCVVLFGNGTEPTCGPRCDDIPQSMPDMCRAVRRSNLFCELFLF